MKRWKRWKAFCWNINGIGGYHVSICTAGKNSAGIMSATWEPHKQIPNDFTLLWITKRKSKGITEMVNPWPWITNLIKKRNKNSEGYSCKWRTDQKGDGDGTEGLRYFGGGYMRYVYGHTMNVNTIITMINT